MQYRCKIFQMDRRRYYETDHNKYFLSYIGISKLGQIALSIKDDIAVIKKEDPSNNGYWPSDIAIGLRVIEMGLEYTKASVTS